MVGPTLFTGLGMQAAADVLNHHIKTKVPHSNSAKHHYGPLDQAMLDRIKHIAPEAVEPTVARKEWNPDDAPDESKLASMQQATYKDGRRAYQVNINPNTDSAYYAHELGHIASRQTKAGRMVANARDALQSNPKLGKALAYSLAFSVPAIGAALQKGDDDLAESLAISAAISSPILIDEALATKNGLAIMDMAGKRASLGQRGRLAGGYMSYVAPVILAGGLGNVTGNVADDYIGLYDL